MLKRKGSTITFVLGADVGQVSVVGDFNGWNPYAHPMRKRSNGTRSVTVDVGGGCHYFRYLAADGAFFDDPEADAFEANGYGGTNSLIVVEEVRPRGRSTVART